MEKKLHKVSDVNVDTKTAICEHCGPVEVYYRKDNGYWICKNNIKNQYNKYYSNPENVEKRKEYLKEYNSKPEVKAVKNSEKNKERAKIYGAQYRAKPEVKQYMVDYEKKEVNKKRRIEKTKVPQQRYKDLIRKAKKKNIECSLSFEEYAELIEFPCFYCNGEFRKIKDSVGYFLDRMDNSLGYISGNCVPCCVVCNYSKRHNITTYEMKIAVNAILEIRKKNGT